jgi:S-adenosylmethionine:tRNA ribosyltransferase-isomerase
MRIERLDYHLPEGAIATHAVEPRDAARMMVVWRSDPGRMEHRHVRDLPEYVGAGHVMVFNTTRVAPARFAGEREDTGGKAEGLYLGPAEGEPGLARALVKARRFREGARIRLHGDAGGERNEDDVSIELVRRDDSEPGAWIVRFLMRGEPAAPDDALQRVGWTPLPPYILAARRREHEAPTGDAEDRARYQTVYARGDARSVAAPTAGMHFTPGLLERLAAAGTGRADVTLHVGTGTFKPVEVEDLREHPMHAEWCSIPAEGLGAIRAARAQGKKVLAVGTTSARTLEAYAEREASGGELPEWLETRLLVMPGWEWRWVDAMLTNFHLPRSTLMAMIAARLESPGVDGVERLRGIYEEAIARGYRFYSYGDAMLILE